MSRGLAGEVTLVGDALELVWYLEASKIAGTATSSEPPLPEVRVDVAVDEPGDAGETGTIAEGYAGPFVLAGTATQALNALAPDVSPGYPRRGSIQYFPADDGGVYELRANLTVRGPRAIGTAGADITVATRLTGSSCSPPAALGVHSSQGFRPRLLLRVGNPISVDVAAQATPAAVHVRASVRSAWGSHDIDGDAIQATVRSLSGQAFEPVILQAAGPTDWPMRDTDPIVREFGWNFAGGDAPHGLYTIEVEARDANHSATSSGRTIVQLGPSGASLPECAPDAAIEAQPDCVRPSGGETASLPLALPLVGMLAGAGLLRARTRRAQGR